MLQLDNIKRHQKSTIKLLNVKDSTVFHFDGNDSKNTQFEKVKKCKKLNKSADKCKQQRHEYCNKYDYRHIPADRRAAGVEFKLLIAPLNCPATIWAENLSDQAPIIDQVKINLRPAMWAFQAEPVMSVSANQRHIIL